MTYKGYKDKDKRRAYKRRQMREYRKTQAEKDAEKDSLIKDASLQITIDSIRDFVDRGSSLEDAEEAYKNYCSAGMWQDYLDFKQGTWKGDTRPAVDSDPGNAIATVKSKAEPFKIMSKAQKEAEARQRVIDILTRSKALCESIERRESAALAAKVDAIREEEEAAFDAKVKRFTDQGVPEKTAIENAQWEVKREKAAEAMRFRKIEHERALMTDAEKTAQKLKLLKDNKKLLRDSHE